MIRRPPRSTPLYSSAASDVYKRQTHYNSGAFDGYDAHDVLILDEFRGQLAVSQLLTMSDPYPCKLATRYADRQAAYTSLYLLSNDGPWDWYPSATEETKRALCRRFPEVREFTSVGKSRVLEKEEVLERMLDSKLASAVVIKSSNLARLCVHMKSCLHVNVRPHPLPKLPAPAWSLSPRRLLTA